MPRGEPDRQQFVGVLRAQQRCSQEKNAKDAQTRTRKNPLLHGTDYFSSQNPRPAPVLKNPGPNTAKFVT